jgi:hypothetical protein
MENPFFLSDLDGERGFLVRKLSFLTEFTFPPPPLEGELREDISQQQTTHIFFQKSAKEVPDE